MALHSDTEVDVAVHPTDLSGVCRVHVLFRVTVTPLLVDRLFDRILPVHVDHTADRLIIHIDNADTVKEVPSRACIACLAGRIATLPSQLRERVLGIVVQCSTVERGVTATKALFTTYYRCSTPVRVVAGPEKTNARIQKWLMRERERRNAP